MRRIDKSLFKKVALITLVFASVLFSLFLVTPHKKNTLKTRASETREAQQIVKPLVGVRHFPGYTSGNHKIRNAQEQLLASGNFLNPPIPWSDRWPYYSVVRSDNTVDIHEDDQRIIDQEIQLASDAGIDYWALEVDWIEDDSNYNYALNLYRSSPNKDLLKFSLIVTAETLKEDSWNNEYLLRINESLLDKQYLKSSSGRPILYMWRFDSLVSELGASRAKERMRQFVQSIETQVGLKPYIVMMDLGSRNTYSAAAEYSVDARTSYLGSYDSCGKGGPYTALVTDNLHQWNIYKTSDLNYIPLVTIGMDPRPKSFDKNLFDFGKDPDWCQQGTPQQIAGNVKQAIEWVKTNNSVTHESNTILLAAWMDITESGWLVPTLNEGNARLNALSKVLGGKIRNTPISPYTQNDPPKHTQGTITNLSITDNSILQADEPFIISGKAPMATRMKIRLQGAGRINDTYILNGKGTIQDRMFSVELPPTPAGGPYVLTITGVDYDVKYVKVYNITFTNL
jgi:hypothetical protein